MFCTSMPNLQRRPQTNLSGCYPQKPAFKVLRSALWSQISVTSSLVGQGNGNWGNSIAHRNPKILNSPSLTLKRASCNDRFPTADDSLLPQLQRELAMNQLLGTRGVTAYWQVRLEHTGGHRSALGREAGLPLAIGSFSGSRVYIMRHFLAHMVNDTKRTCLCCWQCTNRRCLLRMVNDHLLSVWVSTSSSLHQL